MMKFEDLELSLRTIESREERCLPSQGHMIARLDGRSFTRLTKSLLDYDKPFDERFHLAMVKTVCHLMQCGFNILYAFKQSDEVSLLFHANEQAFGRRLGKITTTLSGEASGAFSLEVGHVASFDCRIGIYSEREIIDYFRWRAEDCRRNALNAFCYWKAREEGMEPVKADNYFMTYSMDEKNKWLKTHHIDFENKPSWQIHGSGFYWQYVEKPAFNPKTGEGVIAKRRELVANYQLPRKQAYSDWLKKNLFNLFD